MAESVSVEFAREAEPVDHMARELRRAFGTGELTAFYQPQYDLRTGRLVALEALCRWQHPEYGTLLPDRFIHIAERYGLIAELGRHMLEASGRKAAEWLQRGVRVGISINASPSELLPGFADRLFDRMRALGLPPETLTIEITESPALQNSEDECEALHRLIDGGVGIAVDDFGAGHTTLEGLRRFPFTEVKIDRSLMNDDRPLVDDLVQECVGIARDREAIVVAEGVETAEHFARAVGWGCDRAQGFYFAPALPPDEIEPLLVGAAERG